MDRFTRSFNRAQRAYENMTPEDVYGYDDDRDECEGCPGGCNECEDYTERSKLVIARKARPYANIKPGDCVRVTTGFRYIKNGPRTGYYKRRERVGYGPGHGDKAGQGTWPKGREYKA